VDWKALAMDIFVVVLGVVIALAIYEGVKDAMKKRK